MPVSSRTLLRPLLASLAVIALLAACGGSDDKDAKDTTTTSAPKKETTTTEAAGDDVCSLLSLDALSQATGEDITVAEPDGADTCTYSNEENSAAIALNVGTFEGAAADALEGGKAKCDEGSAADVPFEGADAGFACLVSGVPTVAAAAQGKYAVLTGVATNPDVSTDQVLEALYNVLQDAITGG